MQAGSLTMIKLFLLVVMFALGKVAISWKCAKQTCIARSTTEAELANSNCSRT